MTEETDIKGLCSNCKYAGNCVSLTNSRQPINQCEEFELMPHREDKKAKKKKEFYNYDEIVSELNIYTGLCKNCELRKECALCSPDKVIWQCEEYQ